MRKIELTEAEAAAVCEILHREIHAAEGIRDRMRNILRHARNKFISPEMGDVEAFDYWTERLHALRQIKAKLEREETEDDDAVHQTEN